MYIAQLIGAILISHMKVQILFQVHPLPIRHTNLYDTTAATTTTNFDVSWLRCISPSLSLPLFSVSVIPFLTEL